MGRYLLLIVFAAALGGSILSIGTQGTLDASARHAAEGQADVLAREIAAAGQSAAVHAMLDGDGFRDPTRALGDVQTYEGGQFTIAYTPGATDREATIQVSGSYGGAQHTIESTYAYDPMDAPGPMWLDVPYATASVSSRATLDGGKTDKPVRFDRRKHDEMELEGLLPLASLDAGLGAAVGEAEGALDIPATADWTAAGGLLDHLNVADAEGLYAKAVGALDVSAGDLHYPSAQRVTGALRLGGSRDEDRILMVDGDLTIAPRGRIEGHGVLVVNGALIVEPKDPAVRGSKAGELDWEGIVIVRTTKSVLPLELEGKVTIDGMLVVDHQAFAPGGHLDVSVYRDAAGMSDAAPSGDLSEQRAPWRPSYPWHQHTHAFDVSPSSAPRGDHVYFLENGRAGRHEDQVQFQSLLSRLGDEEVYLEIANGDRHGFSRYALAVNGADGTSGPLRGTVQGGFGTFARADAPLQTRAFEADKLQNLDVDVQSLRALLQAFDDPRCDVWPICIGADWDREGALAVRLHRASDGARLYEATLYWHMRQDEIDTHAAEEAAWRERIEAGEAFGTHLTFGDDVDISFDIEPIDALSERLDFDGDKVRLVATRSSHVTVAEARANPEAPVATGGSGSGGSAGSTEVCLAGQSIRVPADEMDVYLSIGGTLGACGSAAGAGSGSGSGSGSGGSGGGSGGGGGVTICHKPGTSQQATINVGVLNLLTHTLHGDRIGSCSSGDDD